MATIFWIGGAGSQSLLTTGNYSGGALPVTGDSLFFIGGSSTIDTALSTLSGVTLAFLGIGLSFTGTIGTNANSSDYMQVGATVWNINGAGSGRIKIDFGSVQYTGIGAGSGSSLDSGLEAVRVKGSNASNALYITGGLFGVATTRPGETATLASWALVGGQSQLDLASGATWTNGSMQDGTVNVSSGGTLITQNSGTLNTSGSGLIATITTNGTANLNHRPASGNAITTLNALVSSNIDFTGDPRGLLIQNPINVYKGCTLKAFSKSQLQLPGPNPIQFVLQGCAYSDVKLNLGYGFTLTAA